MGTIIRPIVKITKEPAKVSLASNPNFIQFESSGSNSRHPVQISLTMQGNGIEGGENISGFTITELKSGTTHTFRGVLPNDPNIGNEGIFVIGETSLETMENLYSTLQTNEFISDKFILTKSSWREINICSKDAGPEYLFSIKTHSQFLEVSGDPTNSDIENEPVYIELNIINTSVDISKMRFTIIESESLIQHSFEGTKDRAQVNKYTFFVCEDDTETTAQNIRDILLEDLFLGANFKIEVPFGTSTIRLESIGAGNRVAFKFNQPDNTFIALEGNPSDTQSNDSLNMGTLKTFIEADIYSDTGIFLGEDDTPQMGQTFGKLIASLKKSYNEAPIWFDVNSIPKTEQKYNIDFLRSSDWVSSGTIKDYRLIAKRSDSVNKELFYVSDVLYCISGYARNLDNNDLTKYVLRENSSSPISPLTKQPTLFYTYGQTQYFNFILSDPTHNNLEQSKYKLGLKYSLLTQSGAPITEVLKHEKGNKSFYIVNTVKLDIDSLLDEYSNVGIVEVCLARNGMKASDPVRFIIQSDCLYKVHDFAFLNSLGGWSSYCFEGKEQEEFKTNTNTVIKNQTPDSTVSSDIESVRRKDVTQQYTIQTRPIDKISAEWLKELSSSVAVFEVATKRYIVVDELIIRTSSSNDYSRAEMKFHYSDSYNNCFV